MITLTYLINTAFAICDNEIKFKTKILDMTNFKLYTTKLYTT